MNKPNKLEEMPMPRLVLQMALPLMISLLCKFRLRSPTCTRK
jgi:hypothetical protein